MQTFGGQLVTAAITVLGGVLVYVFGQMIIRFLVEPYQNLRRVIGETAASLDYHSVVADLDTLTEQESKIVDELDSHHPEHQKLLLRALQDNMDVLGSARDTLRRHACELSGAAYAIPRYQLWARLAACRRGNRDFHSVDQVKRFN